MVAVMAKSGAQLTEASCAAVMAGNAHDIVERIAELEAALKAVVDVWYGADRERRLPDAMDVAFRALRKSGPK